MQCVKCVKCVKGIKRELREGHEVCKARSARMHVCVRDVRAVRAYLHPWPRILVHLVRQPLGVTKSQPIEAVTYRSRNLSKP